MRYSEWNALNDEEKKNTHWKRHPRMRVATIFSVLFAVVFAVVLLRIFQNKRVHVNRKPNALEAFTVSKTIINSKLKHPGSFSSGNYQSVVDTAAGAYQISSNLNTQDSTGKTVKLAWQINMVYTGGDWADTKSWHVSRLTIKP